MHEVHMKGESRSTYFTTRKKIEILLKKIKEKKKSRLWQAVQY